MRVAHPSLVENQSNGSTKPFASATHDEGSGGPRPSRSPEDKARSALNSRRPAKVFEDAHSTDRNRAQRNAQSTIQRDGRNCINLANFTLRRPATRSGLLRNLPQRRRGDIEIKNLGR